MKAKAVIIQLSDSHLPFLQYLFKLISVEMALLLLRNFSFDFTLLLRL